MNQTMAVLWHDLPAPEALDLGPDAFDTQTVVTAVCGAVTGELDRVVSLDADGGDPIVLYETRIDGLTEGAGVANVESSNAHELQALATVAGFLSRELARITDRGGVEQAAFYRVPATAGDGAELAVYSTAKGFRFAVERSPGDVVATATITDAMASHLATAISDELA